MPASAEHEVDDRANALTIQPDRVDQDRIIAFSHFIEAIERGRPATGQKSRACVLTGPNEEQMPIPPQVFDIMRTAAEILKGGSSVRIVSLDRDLTTQEAADMLNMSRQHLVRLLEEGEIAFTRTGTHRRIRMQDVLAFKQKRAVVRRRALRELTILGEEIGGPDHFPDGGKG
jgi:excisionase family DNA binding protein